MTMVDEWVVYSYTDNRGRHRVNMCTRAMWVSEWAKPNVRPKLELAQVKLLRMGISHEEANRFVTLAKEPTDE